MEAGTRDRMIDAAIRLLATRGLQGASIAEVLELAEAPRGSVYHHFPGGKDELIAAALERAARRSLDQLAGLDGHPARDVADRFFASWRTLLTRTHYRAGCSVLAVTVAADSAALLDAAGGVFTAWQRRLAELFASGGMDAGTAAQQATALLAISEGAVVLCRAERSLAPLDHAAAVFATQLEGAPATRPR
ncbi:TetR/AcrR family transcriptional regulator [Microbacterium sp. NPDC058389]|uniref:TetR/AcrR family transcriptional regulator n=1 Tax=Microbacterium sp. NPDC058389 TaxID=3346475 RepID=UPI003667EF47